MRKKYPEFQDKGADVIVVTSTAPEHARMEFRALKLKVEFPYLCNESGSLFGLYGVPSDLAAKAVALVRSAGKGVLPTIDLVTRFDQNEARELVTGRMDGFFLVDKAGILRYARIGSGVGTMPPNEEILRMLDGLDS